MIRSRGRWKLYFRRLQWHVIRSGFEDVKVWTMPKGDIITVKSHYSSLAICRLFQVFPLSIVWNPWVLMRISFFSWEALLGRILPLDQLKMEGWYLWSKCCFLKEKRNQQIISSFITLKQQCFSSLFLLYLVFSGCNHLNQ